MDSMSIKLPKSLSAKVARLAKSQNVSKTEVVREALEAYTAQRATSPASAVSDLKGCLKGLPKDLSTNPKHLKGYGE